MLVILIRTVEDGDGTREDVDVRALIFDYDGLIVDSETLTATVALEMLKERGAVAELKDLTPFFGATGPAVENTWTEWLTKVLDGRVEKAEFEDLLLTRRHDRLHALPLLPGVTGLIDAGRQRGWGIGLATGQERNHLLASLTRLGIRDSFDAIVTAADVPRPKPAPDIFLETARQLDVEPRDCIVLEDSAPGYEAATAAGMTPIICPCEVTRYGTFANDALLVESLSDVDLDNL